MNNKWVCILCSGHDSRASGLQQAAFDMLITHSTLPHPTPDAMSIRQVQAAINTPKNNFYKLPREAFVALAEYTNILIGNDDDEVNIPEFVPTLKKTVQAKPIGKLDDITDINTWQALASVSGISCSITFTQEARH